MNRLNDKDWDKQKKRVKKVVDKWLKPIGLGWWIVHLKYDTENKDCDEEVANCRVNWPYKEATITFNLSVIENLDDERLNYTVLHEFMHIFVREMRDMGTHEEFSDAIKHEERVCTDLANAMMWAVDNVKKK